MVSAIIGWDNDLTAYDKEVYRCRQRSFPVEQNLVSVLAAELNCPVGQAVTLAGAMRDRAMVRFLRLRDEVSAAGSAVLARYACGLGQWVRGYLDYSGQSPRYTDPANPDDPAVPNRPPQGWTAADNPRPERAGPRAVDRHA